MATAPGQLPGMSGPEDLQAAGDYDQAGMAADPAAAGAEPSVIVCLELRADGSISVYPKDGSAEPVEVQSLEEGVQALGQMAQELATGGSGDPAAAGQVEQQALWDQMAAARPNRGNT